MEPTLAFIPSPSEGVWHLGPLPIRAYALCIIAGVIVAVWLGERRWTARGGEPGALLDIATWAVPFGLVGGRLYHVITDWQLYFSATGHPLQALEIWKGGLGIWGAIALGAVGAWIGCRRKGVSLAAFADTVAPGIALAQAVGRFGNYFNQELYGRPSTLPWALEIDFAHRPDGMTQIATYQPTFLYESLWCVGVALVVLWATKRFHLTHGRAFALYVATYTVGRAWTEWLRIDPAHHILGLRLNDWTALIVFLAAVTYMYLKRNDTSPERIGGPVPAGGAEPESPDGTEDATEADAGTGEAAGPATEPKAETNGT